MSRHFTRRPPKRNGGFSWGRFPSEVGAHVSYRLFRRDHTGRLHVEERWFYRKQARSEIARNLWRARIALRERVDTLDLAAWGIAA